MQHDRSLPEVTQGHETNVGPVGPTSTAGAGQPDQRTVEGAVGTTVVAVTGLVAASYPTAAAGMLAVAVTVFAVTMKRRS